MTDAEEKFNGMLEASGLAKRGSYNRHEVCRVLGFSERTWWRMVYTHEPGAPEDANRDPWTIDAYMTRGHYRVRYDELVSWLARNRAYERIHKADTATLDLPGFG